MGNKDDSLSYLEVRFVSAMKQLEAKLSQAASKNDISEATAKNIAALQDLGEHNKQVITSQKEEIELLRGRLDKLRETRGVDEKLSLHNKAEVERLLAENQELRSEVETLRSEREEEIAELEGIISTLKPYLGSEKVAYHV